MHPHWYQWTIKQEELLYCHSTKTIKYWQQWQRRRMLPLRRKTYLVCGRNSAGSCFCCTFWWTCTSSSHWPPLSVRRPTLFPIRWGSRLAARKSTLLRFCWTGDLQRLRGRIRFIRMRDPALCKRTQGGCSTFHCGIRWRSSIKGAAAPSRKITQYR